MDPKKTKTKSILQKNKKTLKKKNIMNIIFDLDETLVQTLDINFEDNKTYLVENPSLSNIAILNIPGNNRSTFLYIRPYFLKLIDFCYRHFYVSFWTAGTDKYCNSIINILLTPEQKKITKIILSRDSQDKTKIINNKNGNSYSIEDYNQQKPLDLLWENYDFQNFNKKNTLIIDNSYNVTKYYPYNSILVESYCRLNEEDEVLLLLKEKLLNLNSIRKNTFICSKKKKNVFVDLYRNKKLRMPIIQSLSYNSIEKHLSI